MVNPLIRVRATPSMGGRLFSMSSFTLSRTPCARVTGAARGGRLRLLSSNGIGRLAGHPARSPTCAPATGRCVLLLVRSRS